jgi:Domain of unknown function (DUF5671)
VGADPKILDFIAGAKAKGALEQSLVGILTARGWSEKEIYEALASQYEQATGLSIPHRGGSGTAAKDAFFYLLIFSTLATWTVGLGALAFTLIDHWLVDPLFSSPYYRGNDMYSAAASMASIFVAFPIYLLVSRSVLREERVHPEKLNSPVRKWLTYMALVVAACVFIGDLIAALSYFLRGEITSRFLAKAFVVLLISGGVFFYYFGGLKRSEAGAQSQTHRDRWLAVLSALAVTIAVVLGFLYLGAPSTQRNLRADGKRVQDLYQLTMKIDGLWAKDHKLPEHLDEVPDSVYADPVSRAAYEYHAKDGSRYELCATFELPSRQTDSPNSRAWNHPAGRHCFSIDAAKMTENPWVYTY